MKHNQGQQLIFIISQPRAGSTLLQRILAGHPEIHVTAEPWIMLHPLYALKRNGHSSEYNATLAKDALDDFLSTTDIGEDTYIKGLRRMASFIYNEALKKSGKTYFLDKTPRYYFIIAELYRTFPKAKFIFLLRNPLAVLSSILTTWVRENWDILADFKYDLLRAPQLIADGVDLLKRKVLVVHYEDLAANPEQTISSLCRYLKIKYYPEMLDYGLNAVPHGRMGDQTNIHKHNKPTSEYVSKWVDQLASPYIRYLSEIYLSILGPELLARLGYSYDELSSTLHSVKYEEELFDKQIIEKIIAKLGIPYAELPALKIQRLATTDESAKKTVNVFCPATTVEIETSSEDAGTQHGVKKLTSQAQPAEKIGEQEWPQEVISLVKKAEELIVKENFTDLIHACDAIHDALDITPDDPVLLVTLGKILLMMQQKEAAHGEFKKAIKLAPDFVPVLLKKLHIEYPADLAYVQKKTDHENLQHSLAVNQNNMTEEELQHDINNFADKEIEKIEQFLAAGNFGKAQEAIPDVIKRNPDSPDLLNRIAEISFRMGDVEGAKKVFSDILKRYTDHIEALHNLAFMATLENDYETARNTLKRIIQIDPSNNIAIEKLQFLESISANTKFFSDSQTIDDSIRDISDTDACERIKQLKTNIEKLVQFAVSKETRIDDKGITNYASVKSEVEDVEGFLIPGQEEYLFNKVKSLPDDAIIVEIGSHKGRSTVAMGYACKGTKRKIHCIDPWPNTFNEFISNIQKNKLEDFIIPVKGMSQDILKSRHNLVGEKEVDFVFIDGSHEHIDVLKDFELAYPLVKKNGWIALHDVIETWPGPERVWNEIAKPILINHEYCTSIACGQKGASSNKGHIKHSHRPIVSNYQEQVKDGIMPNEQTDQNTVIPPVIFFHETNSDYLKYTLRCIKNFNPTARVILLGDETNRQYMSVGIEHHFFSDYARFEEIELFDKVFKFVAGKEANNAHNEWGVRIALRRWFNFYNFIKLQGFEQFWTFDTDNLIFCNLADHVPKFESYDCTEQCNGICMKGLIGSQKIVKGYLDKINELFSDKDYLNRVKKDYETQPTYAFTEMAAYAEYKRSANIKSIRLNSIIDGETFDDCICQEHDMEMEDSEQAGKKIKKLFFINGNIYTKHLPAQSLIKLNGINMSWVPTSFIENVYNYVTEYKLKK